MYDKNLTKEEIKAIKKGFAYKTWNKSRWLVCLVALFYFLVFSGWKCPVCKEKLPARDLPSSSSSVRMPVLVKTCPHCGADLTEQSEVTK